MFRTLQDRCRIFTNNIFILVLGYCFTTNHVYLLIDSLQLTTSIKIIMSLCFFLKQYVFPVGSKLGLDLIVFCCYISVHRIGLGLVLVCFRPLSTLRRCGQFSWWRKPEYPKKTTDLFRVTDQLCHIICIEYTSPWTGFELITLVVIGTDCTGNC